MMVRDRLMPGKPILTSPVCAVMCEVQQQYACASCEVAILRLVPGDAYNLCPLYAACLNCRTPGAGYCGNSQLMIRQLLFATSTMFILHIQRAAA